MANKTVQNTAYKGLVESLSIPVELHERDGKKFASHGSVVPIHCCNKEEIEQRSEKTHHYCDLFTDDLLAPLEELAFVRIDDTTAEKVFINRSKRILLTSSDGRLCQWRCAPSFESANHYVAGAPLVNKEGALISLVTAKRGNHYAVSTFEGDGGYFETSASWKILDIIEGSLIYGSRCFKTREELRAYVETIQPGSGPLQPVLWRGQNMARIALVESGGRQVAHFYLHGVTCTGVDYL